MSFERFILPSRLIKRVTISDALTYSRISDVNIVSNFGKEILIQRYIVDRLMLFSIGQDVYMACNSIGFLRPSYTLAKIYSDYNFKIKEAENYSDIIMHRNMLEIDMKNALIDMFPCYVSCTREIYDKILKVIN